MALDRLEAMRAFCRIVEIGSFGGAAESLGLAKTTVSGQIQTLELLLGIKLLHRTTRKVSPTTEGAAYYLRARAVLEDVDDLEASVSLSRSAARGRVHIEMPAAVGLLLVVPALREFTVQYPNIHLDIGCSDRVVDLVEEGIDCAIRGGVVTDPNLVCKIIGQVQLALCASPHYLREAPSLSAPDDLFQHRNLGYRFSANNRRYLPTMFRDDEAFNLDVPVSMYFNNGSAYTAATVAGLGIAFVPRAEAQPLIDQGLLTEVLPDWRLEAITLSLVYPYTRHLSARVRAVTDWVSDLMHRNQFWKND
ncbi:LysR substrate-binding domain-containing protein [Pseudomonas sp. 13B_3.2_Bac1]|uniref:LysR substrate-binding domain-containing protein n=1 Tax=Pseudomonas sp. 13B_3.2_Bac1 TaxID=2971623 RepID=UPI0021C8B177|nr:LysR substrate-binding domain-containing protein [Pseudomonas sp. 13B_3.2_Bac1]MCU1771489.1 LysR substrate-binding domain-containing protein [Pseudomonas sp. 13B_3.2_Bac1]